MLKFVAFYSKKYDIYSKKTSLNKSSNNCLPLLKKKKDLTLHINFPWRNPLVFLMLVSTVGSNDSENKWTNSFVQDLGWQTWNVWEEFV